MSANDLLLWLSAKGEGSWSQFRAAVEELHLPDEAADLDQSGDSGRASDEFPVHQSVRLTLQRLGHVEFRSYNGQRRWRVVPPALALLPESSAPGAVGILCGAREPRSLRTLGALPDVSVDVVERAGMPDCVRLGSPQMADLMAATASVGIRTQPAACSTLLSALPSVRDERGWIASEMPATPGWKVHRFSNSQLRWSEVQVGDATQATSGFFRLNLKFQWLYYLKVPGALVPCSRPSR